MATRSNPDLRAPTDKQEKFVAQYLVDLDVGAAAERAGYNADYGRQLIRKPHVLRAIHREMMKRQARIEVDQDYVVNGLVEVVERSMKRKPVMEWDPEDRQMRQKRDEDDNHVWEFEPQAANKALELLGKHIGMFAPVVEIRGFARMLELVASLSPDQAERLLELEDEDLRHEIQMLSDPTVRRITP